jgi:hypothetical protein
MEELTAQSLHLQMLVRALLLEALEPLALALQRQDSLLLQRTPPLEPLLREQREILLEVLSSVQPSQASLLMQDLSLPSPTSPAWSPSWER